ncbi:MAG: calcium/sodium antiporter [Deltaproteobacteria bacterium]|nr:calcium/sodium antiporter [Deltaproteobacteria bacterium]
MLESVLLIVVGLALLAVGGECLLRGAVGLATLMRLTPAIIGLTVVAAGTSLPELFVSILATARDQPDIAVGNAVGSNIFNIGFVLGACALIRPLAITGNSIKLEYPVLAIVTLLFLALAQDGFVNGLDGLLCLVVYVLFTTYMVTLVRAQVTESEKGELAGEVASLAPSARMLPAVGWVVLGAVLLGVGASWTVDGAVRMARLAGLSERVIGLTIVAGGTSLPEVVASLVSTLRGRDDVAIGNVIGSNIFNVLGILGTTALVRPLPVHAAIATIDGWWMMGITLLLFPIMFTRLRIDRGEGVCLLAAYAAYTVALLLRPA